MTQIRARIASAVLAAAAVFSTMALATPASAAPEKDFNPPSVQAVRCDSTYVPPDRDPRTVTAITNARIRTGPSTACTAVGQTAPGHRLNYHCYVSGDGGTWTYVRDLNNSKRGWVKDTLLPLNPDRVTRGSLERC